MTTEKVSCAGRCSNLDDIRDTGAKRGFWCELVILAPSVQGWGGGLLFRRSARYDVPTLTERILTTST
jgi:hypothetical protein